MRVVPRQRRFIRSAPGYLEATRLGSEPTSSLGRWAAGAKHIVIGRPFATSQAIHERLSKFKALAVFSSDPLSSAAYGPEEIMLVLVLAGSGMLYLALPIAAAIIALLWTVRLSYLQTIRAYPNGGGAYIVAHENLGQVPGLVAAASLQVDYVLTVAVSVAAGVAAITSAVPGLLDFRVLLAIVAVGMITWGNLRGVRESGAIFALPTYFFILTFGAMIIVGMFKLVIGAAPGSLLHSAPTREQIAGTQGLTLFLILRAFSSGCSALTGVEAISNGVPAFKPPESRNARTTMQWEAGLLAAFVLGVAFLGTRFGLVPNSDETIVSMLGREIFGKNVLYYAYQAATAAVLLLAANTAYADFPRLSAILAKDRFAPRQLAFRGDRLAFSNGIILLGAVAGLLLVAFGANVTKLIPLYTLGVFVSMTLSQFGMVRHWWRLREPGWRISMILNGVGAVATGVVSVVVASTKLTQGAWISVLMMITLFVMFTFIRRHYDSFSERIKVDDSALPQGAPMAVPVERSRGRVVVPVDDLNQVSLSAIQLAREVSSNVIAVHVTDDRDAAEALRGRWNRAVPDVPLLIIDSPYRVFTAPLLAYVESVAGAAGEAETGEKVVVILPTFVPKHWWERILHNRDVLRLKPFLKANASVRVVECSYRLDGE
jgi:amino acid transporter